MDSKVYAIELAKHVLDVHPGSDLAVLAREYLTIAAPHALHRKPQRRVVKKSKIYQGEM